MGVTMYRIRMRISYSQNYRNGGVKQNLLFDNKMSKWFGLILTVSIVTYTKGQPNKHKSIACTTPSPCMPYHHLICEDYQYVHVVSASFGFKRDCPAHITNTECPRDEVQRCCSEATDEPIGDCHEMLNNATFTNLLNACAKLSVCSFQNLKSLDVIQCRSRSFYSYSKVEYTCEQKVARRPENDDSIANDDDDEDDIPDNTVTPVIVSSVVGILLVVASIAGAVIYISKKRNKRNNTLQEKLTNKETLLGRPRVIVDETVNYCSGDGYESGLRGPKVVVPLTNVYTEVDDRDFAKDQPSSCDYGAYSRVEGDNSNVITSLEDTYNHVGGDNSNINKQADETYNHIPHVKNTGDDNYQHIGESRGKEFEENSEYNHIR